VKSCCAVKRSGTADSHNSAVHSADGRCYTNGHTFVNWWTR